MLEVQNLSMRFGGLLAVDQVSLDVQEHEIVEIGRASCRERV